MLDECTCKALLGPALAGTRLTSIRRSRTLAYADRAFAFPPRHSSAASLGQLWLLRPWVRRSAALHPATARAARRVARSASAVLVRTRCSGRLELTLDRAAVDLLRARRRDVVSAPVRGRNNPVAPASFKSAFFRMRPQRQVTSASALGFDHGRRVLRTVAHTSDAAAMPGGCLWRSPRAYIATFAIHFISARDPIRRRRCHCSENGPAAWPYGGGEPQPRSRGPSGRVPAGSMADHEASDRAVAGRGVVRASRRHLVLLGNPVVWWERWIAPPRRSNSVTATWHAPPIALHRRAVDQLRTVHRDSLRCTSTITCSRWSFVARRVLGVLAGWNDDLHSRRGGRRWATGAHGAGAGGVHLFRAVHVWMAAEPASFDQHFGFCTRLTATALPPPTLRFCGGRQPLPAAATKEASRLKGSGGRGSIAAGQAAAASTGVSRRRRPRHLGP